MESGIIASVPRAGLGRRADWKVDDKYVRHIVTSYFVLSRLTTPTHLVDSHPPSTDVFGRKRLATHSPIAHVEGRDASHDDLYAPAPRESALYA
jgi:hypothetical protein